MSTRPGTLRSTSVIAGVLGFASTLTTGIVHAQTATSNDTLEEIVVTAERRVEDAQRTGTSISVRSGEDLLRDGKFSLSSILEDIPGVTGGAAFATGGTGGGGTDTPASGLVIRGIPSNVGAGGSTTSTAPAAAIYVDGVYNGIGGGYDIDRVEMLRGPQGTLYGRSATAGLVAIHTRNPDLSAVGGSTTVEAGNHNLQHYTAVLNLPMNDKLGVRVAGNRYERDGFLDADAGAVRSTDGKIKVLYQPNDDFSLLVGAAVQDNVDHSGGHLIGVNPDPQQVVYADIPMGEVTNKFRQYWAELNWDVGFGTLTYQPAYRSWVQEGVLYAYGVLGYVTEPVTTPKDHFVTHELRLSSSPDSKLIWQVGTLYYDNDLENTNSVYLGPIDPAVLAYTDIVTKETKAFGTFAQATYPVTDTWRVTAGVRYDKTKVTATESYQLGPFLVGPGPLPPPFTLSGDQGKRDFSNWTYKLRLEHDLTTANLLYASVSTGFSPGDVTVTASCPADVSATPPCAMELTAETLTSYEIGSKNRFLDDTLQANVSAFYSKYGSYQSAAINVNEAAGPPLFAPLSAPLESYGLELEMLYKFTAADLLGFNFGWTQSQYVDKPALFARFVAEDDVTSNSAPASVAPIPLSASLSYQHTFILAGDSTLSLRGEALYSGSHGGHVNQAQKDAGQQPLVDVDSAVLGNVSATWAANKHLTVGGYVRNVTDHRYFTKVSVDTSANGYMFQQTLNDPRTYGVVLNVSF